MSQRLWGIRRYDSQRMNDDSLFHLVLLLSYYLNMEEPGQDQTEASEGVYDDISLNNKPEKELTCKYRTGIKINDKINHLSENYGISRNLLKKFESLINKSLILISRNIDVGQISVNVEPTEETHENLHKTGILTYSAIVNDRIIGQDKYTEVRIQPQHHLTNIFIR